MQHVRYTQASGRGAAVMVDAEGDSRNSVAPHLHTGLIEQCRIDVMRRGQRGSHADRTMAGLISLVVASIRV
ncbi:hypothetical protein AXW67_29030 [Bradyrhizobium neotropicale]|uniref:Uncharacterized protein n=1 Tax=Bradyrhizobium neotropicale TaxID=1497615 RepID=A0A176YPP4_9BRAD|nr:hypothetical protein AXW67_29030 [Bradyrhizobium neotropicale]